MNPVVALHNMHREGRDAFLAMDPQLRQLKLRPYSYSPPLLENLPTALSGIYTLSGGRQIGKTTLVKQWMLKLLAQGVDPRAIAFLSGEILDDHHALLQAMRLELDEMPKEKLCFLAIDEVTYIQGWDKAIKYAADAGLFERCVVLLTGSDISLIRDARMRFPGRRGTADQVNFHLYPLSFCETLNLKGRDKTNVDVLFAAFQEYLVHGGYLTAINDMASHQRILPATLVTYSDWIRGDMLKRGKQEHYLKEVLSAIQKRQGSQLSWHALARDLSIDHHKTVSDYVCLLEDMDVLFVQSVLLEDKLTAAPKKAKKIIFADPFIDHAVRAWINPGMANPMDINPHLVESTAISHYRRHYPTYYIKAAGEVDIAYVDQGQFWPVEVKWTRQLHPKDLAQVVKYSRAKILTALKEPGLILSTPTEPLPIALMNLG